MERKGSDFALQVRQQGQDEDHDLAGDEVQGDNGEEDGGDAEGHHGDRGALGVEELIAEDAAHQAEADGADAAQGHDGGGSSGIQAGAGQEEGEDEASADGGDVIAEQSEAQDPEPGEAHGLRELIHLFPTVKKPLLERFGELPDVVEQACPIA